MVVEGGGGSLKPGLELALFHTARLHLKTILDVYWKHGIWYVAEANTLDSWQAT